MLSSYFFFFFFAFIDLDCGCNLSVEQGQKKGTKGHIFSPR